MSAAEHEPTQVRDDAPDAPVDVFHVKALTRKWLNGDRQAGAELTRFLNAPRGLDTIRRTLGFAAAFFEEQGERNGAVST